jgi:endoglucanase
LQNPSSLRRTAAALSAAAVLCLAALVAWLAFRPSSSHAQPSAPPAAVPLPLSGSLRAGGGEILDSDGRPLRLLGVNRSGTEYECVENRGIFDGPSNDGSVAAIASWGTNAVRVLLNEDCWLGINGVRGQFGGAAYQDAIYRYVTTLHRRGLNVVLSLIWAAPGGQTANQLNPMPDADHAATFWAQVAKQYAADSGYVAFDLFSEPYPDHDRDSAAAWSCWLHGGTCAGVPYEAAGMQTLVSAVRQTGAHNLLVLGGVRYALSLTGWLANEPNDPDHNLAASWHVYDSSDCPSAGCFSTEAGPVIGHVPLIALEFGQTNCDSPFPKVVMAWLNAHHASELAWTWDAWGGCQALIADYTGAPTPYGAQVKANLKAGA